MSAPVTVNGFYKVHGVKVTPTHPTHTHTQRRPGRSWATRQDFDRWSNETLEREGGRTQELNRRMERREQC